MREVDVKRNRAKLLGEGQRTHDDVNILVEEKFDLYARLQAKMQLCNNTVAIGLFPETSSSFLLADPSAHYCNKHYAFGNCSRILADTMQEIFESGTQDESMYTITKKQRKAKYLFRPMKWFLIFELKN
jgi:hypothetical protein